MLKKLFILSILLILTINISFVKLITSPVYVGWVTNIVYIAGILFLTPYIYQKATKWEWLYIGAMLLGLLFHINLQGVNTPINDSFKWIFLILIIVAARKYKTPKFIFYILIAFFVVHCGIAILEKTQQTHLFDYSFIENFENFEDSSEFRSFGLMEHPLFAANIVVIIMSFILVSQNINFYVKVGLLVLGTYAVFCFNSRAAMVVWLGILFYRTVLYNRKPIFAITLGAIFLLLFNSDILILIQQNSDIFGRLAEDTSLGDESSMTRVLSYVYFWNQRWSFDDIVYGGRIIYMPGTDASLENGILLNIAWWGWIVGIIKVVLELIITYSMLNKYEIKEKIIVMIACWGVAFANNNSFNTFVFVFFIITHLSIDSLTTKQYLKTLIKMIDFKNAKNDTLRNKSNNL